LELGGGRKEDAKYGKPYEYTVNGWGREMTNLAKRVSFLWK
jgi:hypothetical protein